MLRHISKFYFFLSLSNIACICHNLFIHLCVEKYVTYFYSFDVMDSAAMEIDVQVLEPPISTTFSIFSGIELLDYRV